MKEQRSKIKNLFIVLLIVIALTGCLPKKTEQGKEETSTSRQIESETAQKETEIEQKGEEGGLTGTIKELVGLGKSLKCTWEKDDFSSTGYIKGKKYYGEVNQPDEEGNQRKAYVVIKDECMWSWDENKAEGIKMCFDASEMEGMEGADSSEKSVWDMESSVTGTEYKCVPAIVPDSRFDLPENVNFMDMQEMMEGFNQ